MGKGRRRVARRLNESSGAFVRTARDTDSSARYGRHDEPHARDEDRHRAARRLCRHRRAGREYAAAGLRRRIHPRGQPRRFLPALRRAQSGAPLDIYTNVAIAFPRSPMHLAYRRWICSGSPAAGSRSASAARSARTSRSATAHVAQAGRPDPRARRRSKAIFACFQDGQRLDFRGEHYPLTLMTPVFIPAPPRRRARPRSGWVRSARA